MSYMKGDLLTKTKRLVKGLAKREPIWLKPMEKAPPAVFPRSNGKVKVINLPEDVYITKFYQKHPESKYEDPIKLNSFHPVPARIFASRVLELKEQGVREEEAIAVADMEYRAERKTKKQAYTRLKQISRILDKKPPPNPYPSAIKEIQAEERPYVRERFFDPQILDLVNKIKEEKAAEMQERFGGQDRFGRQDRPRGPGMSGGQHRFVGQGMPGGQGMPQGMFGGQNQLGGQGMFGGQAVFGGQDRLGRQDLFGGQDRLGVQDGNGGQVRNGVQDSIGGQSMFGGVDSLGGQQRS